MRRKRFKVSDFKLGDFQGGIEIQMNKDGEPYHILMFNQDGTITLAGSINRVDDRFQSDSEGRIKITTGNY